MHRIIVGIGSNTIDRWERVEKALHWLNEFTMSSKKSSIYHTKPEGKNAGSVNYTYANAVFFALTPMAREDLEVKLKQYEVDNGRDERMKTFGIVPIDLDLVYFDEELIRPNEMARDYFRRGYEEIFTR
ncbi:MAG: 2-amino-4-hydroxy-6-hydroxymethyldihydropteridine diphosphokinase [Muribaculaceae bacterium]|nr:2-amino-4-hydroxy-6-hydroxymethyldihydropteridine diphosphokinase [Muribaculaceae bacterium]